MAPRHSARAVPEGKAARQASEDSRVGWRQLGPHKALPSSPGDVQENNALGFQVLNLGGQVSSVTLEAGMRESVGGTCMVPKQPPSHLGLPTPPVSAACSPPLGCAWLDPWSCPSGSRRRLSVGDRGRCHHLVTGTFPRHCLMGPVVWQTQVSRGHRRQNRWAWEEGCCWQTPDSPQHRTSCSESGC